MRRFWPLIGRILTTLSIYQTVSLILSAIEVDIASTALRALRQLPNSPIIFSNATGSLGSGDLMILAANVIVHAPEKGVPVDEATFATARSVLGREESRLGSLGFIWLRQLLIAYLR